MNKNIVIFMCLIFVLSCSSAKKPETADINQVSKTHLTETIENTNSLETQSTSIEAISETISADNISNIEATKTGNDTGMEKPAVSEENVKKDYEVVFEDDNKNLVHYSRTNYRSTTYLKRRNSLFKIQIGAFINKRFAYDISKKVKKHNIKTKIKYEAPYWKVYIDDKITKKNLSHYIKKLKSIKVAYYIKN